MIGESIDEFIADQRAFSIEPAIDWPCSLDGVEVIASETIELQYNDGGRGRLEQLLGRTNEFLILLSRLENRDTIELTRLVLPLPLDVFESAIEPCHPSPCATYALHLQPEMLDGIICMQSTQLEEGRWGNRTSHGVPIYGSFESIDRNRLEDLRNRLFHKSSASPLNSKDEPRRDPTA